MDETTSTLTTADGIDLHLYRWAPDGPPRAVVQVQHGLAEHAGRYRRFAEALTAAGFLVYAPDARGSGLSAAGAYGSWGPDGWNGWVNDLLLLNQRIHAENPDLPVALFGHSMGSFASQQYLLDHSATVDAVVLCGSADGGPLSGMLGGDEPADLSAFNAPFENRTGFEWLSRDEAEVDAYVADPMCGWAAPAPAGIEALQRTSEAAQVAGVRPDLPILMISGDADPLAGGGPVVETVAQRYRDAGVRDVELILYPGARHELLNETNRDQVTADVIAFLDRVLPG